MELEITQEILKIKHKVINELDGTADFYKTYRHVNGDFSISEHLLNQCMQAACEAAYDAGYAAGQEDGYEDGFQCGRYEYS